MLTLLSGLAAGIAHVFTGPDHLGAVAPLAVTGRQRAWRSGIRWGSGHAAGVAFVGILALALRDLVPVERLSSTSERLVGILLLGLSLWSFRQGLRLQVHRHEHEHDGEHHAHLHFHGPGHVHAGIQGEGHEHGHAAFGIGTLHGLAGTSHLLGVLPSLALPTRAEAVLYLGAFCVGTLLAMGLFAWGVGRFASGIAAQGAAAYRRLLWACSFSTLVIGAWWVWLP